MINFTLASKMKMMATMLAKQGNIHRTSIEFAREQKGRMCAMRHRIATNNMVGAARVERKGSFNRLVKRKEKRGPIVSSGRWAK